MKIEQPKSKTNGFRTFSFFGHHIWKSLPQDLRHCSVTLSSFTNQIENLPLLTVLPPQLCPTIFWTEWFTNLSSPDQYVPQSSEQNDSLTCPLLFSMIIWTECFTSLSSPVQYVPQTSEHNVSLTCPFLISMIIWTESFTDLSSPVQYDHLNRMFH